jgi:hypothetical protein
MQRFDPLLRDLPLSLEAVYYPVGFPVRVATNSHDVIEAAAESWSMWQPEFAVEPVVMRVVVESEGELAPAPRYRMQGHLIHIVSDPRNFAVADTRALFASIHVSQKTAADHTWLRWFYTESLPYLLLAQRYLAAVHAACIARNGVGIMLCGVSASGKSTLAFACARAGFTYIADDCTWLLNGSTDRIALGRPHMIRFRHDAARHFPELEGWVARARPNGKVAIEIPTSEFPHIMTARKAPIGRIVFLARDSRGPAALESVARAETAGLLLRDMPSYGKEVDMIHQRTVETLTEVPAFRLHYRSLDEAVTLLSGIS